MKMNATTRWHRPVMSARRDGDVGVLELDGESVRCAFPLVVKVAGGLWAYRTTRSHLDH